MGYKTFMRLTDAAEDFVRWPCDETLKALDDFQTEINWPWSATQEQLDEWSLHWQTWDANLSAHIDAQKNASVWPIRTRDAAVKFHTTAVA